MIGVTSAPRTHARRTEIVSTRRLAVPAGLCVLSLLPLIVFVCAPALQPRALLLLATGRAATQGQFELGWLGALLLHAGDSFAGYAGVLAGSVTATFALGFCVFARTRMRAGAGYAFAAAGFALLAALDAQRVGGDAPAWLGAAAYLLALDRAPRRSAWVAPAIALLWCNASPAGLLAPFLGVLLALGRASADGPRDVRALVFPVLASFAALLGTPEGFAYPERAAAALHLGSVYGSLLPLAPLGAAPLAFRPIAVLVVAGAAWLWSARARALDVPLVLGAFALTFVDGAFLPLLGIVAAPAVAGFAPRSNAVEPDRDETPAAILVGATVAVITLLMVPHVPTASLLRDAPRALFERLAADGKPHVVVCGVVAWCDDAVLAPNLRAFLDERVERANPGVLQAEGTIGRAQAGWPEALRRSGADALVMRARSPLAQLAGLRLGWVRVAAEGDAVLYEPRAASR